MKPIDFLIIAIIAVIIGLVVWYIHRSKKKGIKCIGCPNGGNCSGGCGGACGSCGHDCGGRVGKK